MADMELGSLVERGKGSDGTRSEHRTTKSRRGMRRSGRQIPDILAGSSIRLGIDFQSPCDLLTVVCNRAGDFRVIVPVGVSRGFSEDRFCSPIR